MGCFGGEGVKITIVDTCVTVISKELAELRNGGEPDMTGPEAHQPSLQRLRQLFPI